ncbi:hypothetical protein TSOC_010175 [Tetrabaena socialis]|uniref:Uncharacterized protein n=1 Tax=Tetrabaena socialis TaxID=47790 RepID=A0A2J7ZTY1_9CHLO|nr:hypothetical protein TSOC_010175 [Tetrabaena socialis]|eukprot:PNH03729.1 hypothetical protein TSOC_010175 [Tetrabaena socialis]
MVGAQVLGRVAAGEELGHIVDLLVYYMTSHWLVSHKAKSDKTAEVGPAAAKSVLSLLSGVFTRINRIGAYEPPTGSGNHCISPKVKDFRRGYERLSGCGGYLVTAAVPL